MRTDDGHGTEEQWQLYRERNGSPDGHDLLLAVYGHGELGRGPILATVRQFSHNGEFQRYDMLCDAQRQGVI